MNTPVGIAILIALSFLFGLYEIGYGFYAWRLNGFPFYITAGFLIGLPFLAIAASLLLLPAHSLQRWELLPLLMWLFGVTWKAWRKRMTRLEHPVEWAKWEAILQGGKG